ncbi:STAS domain-containing protein [Actinoplanes sp. GCM10030250]
MSMMAAVSYRTDPDGVVDATITGELDLAEADSIRDSLVSAARGMSGPYLRVDLSQVSFMDSYALGALVSARNTAASVGVTLTLVDPSPPVRKAIEVTGLSDVFGLADQGSSED